MKKEFNLVLNKNEFRFSIKLSPGTYYYRFKVDGVDTHDPEHKVVKNESGKKNNIIYIRNNKIFDTKKIA